MTFWTNQGQVHVVTVCGPTKSNESLSFHMQHQATLAVQKTQTDFQQQFLKDLAKLVSDISDAEKMIGSSVIGPTKSEIEGRELFRLSCVATTHLSTGH